jgi:c-di-GMP phosphodiesterase
VAAMDSNAFPLITLMPISDAAGRWAALELRGASGDLDSASLEHLFGPLKLGEALSGLPCLVPLSQPAPLEATTTLPAGQIIVLLPAAAEGVAQELVADLRKHGYRFMIPGTTSAVAGDPAYSLAIPVTSAEDKGILAALPLRPGPHLLQALEDQDQLRPFEAAGFDWFGGSWPLHRKGHGGHHDGPSRVRLLRLLSLVARDADVHELESAIKQDPTLSYQLLKLVNSVAFGLNHPIDHLNQALVALGRRQLQRWLQLLLYTRPESASAKGMVPLMPWAALRGALMENVCASLGASLDERDSAYMTGTFSLLDTLFGTPMAELLKPLNLSSAVANALLTRGGGRLGLLLQATEAAEQGDLALLNTTLADLGLGADTFAGCLCESYRWAIQVGRES